MRSTQADGDVVLVPPGPAASAPPGEGAPGGAAGPGPATPSSDAVLPGPAAGGGSGAGAAVGSGDGSGGGSGGDGGGSEPQPVQSSAPPPPAYRCWNGTTAATLDRCGLPYGWTGARWMFPNGPSACSRIDVGHTTADLEAFRCEVWRDNFITYVRWTSWEAAQARYGLGASRTWLTSGNGAQCGIKSYGQINDRYVGEFIYQAGGPNHFWYVNINSPSFDGRSVLQSKIGATRPCDDIRGVRNS